MSNVFNYQEYGDISMKDEIAGNLTRYRKALHISQERLAEKAGVTRQSINNYEKGKTLPDSKTLSSLAYVLGVTLDDLLRPEGEDELLFRFRARASFAKQPQFAAQVLQKLETYTQLEQVVGLRPYSPESTPCDKVQGNEAYIQEIATQFRRRLGLGDAPIANLFNTVEGIGLKVLRCPLPIEGFFGLSACSVDHGAFILINTDKITIEKQLFTLAHEIGHLIFHRGDYRDTLKEEGTKEEEKAREKVSDYFAGHLLVAQSEFDRVFRFTKDILKLKQYFRVSYQVILSRLAEMRLIDYGKELAKIRAIYRDKHGNPLQGCIELDPKLDLKEFPENERYINLIWQALTIDEITETTAAELLGRTLEDLGNERLHRHRQDSEVYAIS